MLQIKTASELLDEMKFPTVWRNDVILWVLPDILRRHITKENDRPHSCAACRVALLDDARWKSMR